MNIFNATYSPKKFYAGRDRITIPGRGIHLGATKEQVEGMKQHPITRLWIDRGILVISEGASVQNIAPVANPSHLDIPENLKPGDKKLANAQVTKVDSQIETIHANAETGKDETGSKVESGRTDKAKAKTGRK